MLCINSFFGCNVFSPKINQNGHTLTVTLYFPSKRTSPFTPMGEITVEPNGVLKLLNNMKMHKAPGPDGLSARVLKFENVNADLMVKGKKEMTNVKDVLHKNQGLPLITYHQS